MPGPADVIRRRFETPDEVREMELGRFELIALDGRTIGRATYQPGHLVGAEPYAVDD
jgi:hypothetical protein